MRIGFYPGTFDPVHLGHVDIARRASVVFDELIIGVYDRPQKNLTFSLEERLEMVEEAFNGMAGLVVKPYSGLTVAYAKEMGVVAIVRGLRVFSDFESEFRMALANKRLEPSVETVSLITSEQHMYISSTTVREIASLGGDVSSMVPPNVNRALGKRYNNA